jgi:DNA-binding SARP family transcriptional activator
VISLGWAALLLVGLPVGLIRLAGWPLPTHLPSHDQLAQWIQQPLTRETVIAAAACVAWLMWAALLYAALSEVYTYAARLCRHLPRIRPPGPLQGLSAAMLGTVAVSTAAAGTAPAAHASVAAAGTDTAHQALPVLASHGGAVAVAGVAPPVASAGPDRLITVQADGHPYTVAVQPGDTLWDIAHAWLGDPQRWPEIYHLNSDRYDDHGRMRDGDHIEPDWVLTLPDDATPPAGAKPSAPAAQARPDQPAPASPRPSTAPPQPGPAPGTPPSQPPTTPPTSTAPSAPGDDGMADPALPRPSGPTSPTPSAPTSSPGAPRSPASPPRAQRPAPPGVSLPGGSWVDLGLAAAIIAAVALVWAHRRHRYIPRPPSPQLRLDDPAVQPMPAVITQIRRGLRRPAHPPIHDPVDADLDGVDADGGDEPDTPPDDDPDFYHDADAKSPFDHTLPPATPALNNRTLEVWPPAGLGLTGPGAGAAARGFLAAALAAGGLDDPDARSRVVIPAATAATLLGAAATLPDTPRLTVTAGLDEALEILDEQTLHRTRLVYRHEADNVAALRHADPFEEPLPPIVFIADATAHHERTRISALLAQGQRLDIHGVLLGAWPNGNTVVVACDGATTPADGEAIRHGHHPADVGRLAVLNPTETADLLTTLVESHTGLPQAPAPTEPVPADSNATTGSSPSTASTAQPVAAEAAPDSAAEVATEPSGGTGATSTTASYPAQTAPPPSPPAPALDASTTTASEDKPAEPGSAEPVEAAGDDDTDDSDGNGDDSAAAAGPGRVEVTVLGAPTIVDADPTTSLRAKSLELLVYLAIHDGDASQEAILDDLLPDAPAAKAPHRLHTYVSALRKTLRHTGGPGTYLTHPAHRYALNPDTVDVDLWRMRHALREAAQTTDDQARVAALRRAVATYAGPLAHDFDYEWIEPYRQAVRQQALDACLALADALQGQPTETLAVLEAALRHNPHAEPLYQAAMRAHAALGHLDAIRTLRRTLTRHLAEIDAEPSDDTIALADHLVAGLQRPTRRSGPRPAPRPGDGAGA